MLKSLIVEYLNMKYKSNNCLCVDDECAICIEPIHKEYVPLFVCNHKFHKHCINKWLQINNYCPLCRNDLSIVFLHTLYDKANSHEIHKNISVITNVIKHTYERRKVLKLNSQNSNVIFGRCTNWNIVYYDIREDALHNVVLSFVYMKKLYSFHIITATSSKSNDKCTYNCFTRQQYSRVELILKFDCNFVLTVSFLT